MQPARCLWLCLSCCLLFVSAWQNPHHRSLASLAQGRYGHSAAYLPDDKILLLIGGQVTLPQRDDPFITNDVLALDMSVPHDNPRFSTTNGTWMRGLLPNAFAACAVDRQNKQVWLIGGLTQDCESDEVVTVLDARVQTWTPFPANDTLPPRRRQAQAVLMNNPASYTPSIYLWGGIAEEYTCSADTVGYMGLDVWSLATRQVKTYSWEQLSRNLPKKYKPPIRDYAALVLPDQQCIAFIGGHVSETALADMKSILVLEGTKMQFTLQNVTSHDVPSPRSGHAAVWLMKSRLLISGGVDEKGLPVESDWYLDVETWKWSRVALSQKSLPAPHLLWHTATKIDPTTVAVAFGLDAKTRKSSNQVLYFNRNKDMEWVWTRSYTPALPKPKSSAGSAQLASLHAPTTNIVPTSAIATSTATVPPIATPTSKAHSMPASKIFATTVGSLFAFAVLLAGGLFLAKKKKGPKLMHKRNKSETSFTGDTGRPVSELLFTRQIPQRRLALESPASTISHRSSHLSPVVEQAEEFGGPHLALPPRSRCVSPTQASVASYPYLTAVPMSPTTSKASVSTQGSPTPTPGSPSSVSSAPGLLTYVKGVLSPRPQTSESTENLTAAVPRVERSATKRLEKQGTLHVVNVHED